MPARQRIGRLAVAFRQGKRESGFVENQNITIEYRWAEGRVDNFLQWQLIW
jgi:hypothetical protein